MLFPFGHIAAESLLRPFPFAPAAAHFGGHDLRCFFGRHRPMLNSIVTSQRCGTGHCATHFVTVPSREETAKGGNVDQVADQTNVSNAKRLVDLRAGLTVSASAASIAFLWTHWELLYAIENEPLPIERLGDKAWGGKGYGGSGEWYLQNASFDAHGGEFEFYNFVRYKSFVSRGRSVFAYRRVSAGAVSYWGHAWGELPPVIGWLKPVLEPRAKRVMVTLNEAGGKAAERITADPSLVRLVSTSEAAETWDQMRLDEERQLAGAVSGFQQFTRRDGPHAENSPSSRLKAELESFQPMLVCGSAILDYSDFEKAIAIFEIDPAIGAAKLRSILEPVVHDLFIQRMKRSPTREETLGRQLGKIKSWLPTSISTAMATVIKLGNKGIHRPPGRNPSRIDYLEFRISFDSLLCALKWYLELQ